MNSNFVMSSVMRLFRHQALKYTNCTVFIPVSESLTLLEIVEILKIYWNNFPSWKSWKSTGN